VHLGHQEMQLASVTSKLWFNYQVKPLCE